MAAYVVRHAKAGDRAEWKGDDRLRPLTKSGREQAVGLAERLQSEPIERILSSPYVRCLQTVEPLAARRKLPIEPRKDLEEGAGGESVIDLLQEAKGQNVVLCTHGDVVEELLERLIEQAMVVRARASNEKAGTWVLYDENGTITSARYLSPPSS
jgi:phosphohistidine phosphatase SixA